MSPTEGAPSPLQPLTAAPQPEREPGTAEDAENAGGMKQQEVTVDMEKQEDAGGTDEQDDAGNLEETKDADDMEAQKLLAQPSRDAREEEGPRMELHRLTEETESGARRKIVLSPLEKFKLSTLNLASEAEPEPPLKPARLRLQAPPEADPALWGEQGTWEEEEDIAMEGGRWLQAGA